VLSARLAPKSSLFFQPVFDWFMKVTVSTRSSKCEQFGVAGLEMMGVKDEGRQVVGSDREKLKSVGVVVCIALFIVPHVRQ
jgi:hypothetical protein